MCDQNKNGGAPARATGVRIEKIERNSAGQLVAYLTGADEPVVDVRIARCFPWSLPDAYISIRNADGLEIALLQTLDDLNPESRKIAEAELREKVFNPKIRRIVRGKHEFGISSFTAETDRGEVTFQIRGRDDIRFLSATRVLFRDVDGNTYELSDFNSLDPAGKKHLERYF